MTPFSSITITLSSQAGGGSTLGQGGASTGVLGGGGEDAQPTEKRIKQIRLFIRITHLCMVLGQDNILYP